MTTTPPVQDVETHDVSTPVAAGAAGAAESPLGSPLRPGRDDPVPESPGELADLAAAGETPDGDEAAADAPAASSSGREQFNKEGFQAAVDKAVAEASAAAFAAAMAATPAPVSGLSFMRTSISRPE